MAGRIVHGGGLAAAASVYGGAPADWLDLSTGINPHAPDLPTLPIRVLQRLPDSELEEAVRVAARRFYQSGARLPLPVPGTQSVIQLLPRLVKTARSVAILAPTYGEYERCLRAAGLAVDLIADLDEVCDRHGLVVVVNPNNPTGRVYAPDDLKAVAARLDGWGGLLVVDEAFADLSPEISLAASERANLIVLRSFGKFFGMAGIRLGFVIARDDVVAAFSDWLGPWSVSGPALYYASHLMTRDPEQLRAAIRVRSEALARVVLSAGLEVRGAAGLFTLVTLPDAQRLHEHLCVNHILTRKFDYCDTWLRIGLAPDADADDRLAAALSTYVR
ncbi:threonine-phosphate decarboxylase CobD [Peteryoungia ipomoeae]|uniref:threonine-phosphate decarboxylase n=1 Tax=Peteryoungia ipomoeae TaxID=1210932 RepID=A0A4S8P6U0_9HYPH|nr:threonine-phosphate decarboxylase CobD [Peteryoungia ipomoeae]THV25035.1 threonine-phosphate decarboxylase [Peteryoungia ipomoeae]